MIKCVIKCFFRERKERAEREKQELERLKDKERQKLKLLEKEKEAVRAQDIVSRTILLKIKMHMNLLIP